MTDMQNQKPTESLKDCVLSAIDREQVCVRSRWFFVCKEAFVWSLWVLSVVVGALAVAVSLFVLSHQQYALYEATHDSWVGLMVQVLPYVWLILLVVMTVVALANVRCMNRGYRYQTWHILLSSLVLSIAGGLMLHSFGLGYLVDQQIGKGMPMYMSQEKFERKLWQAPNDGRLLGTLAHRTSAPTSTIVFEDVLGTRWNIDVSELHLNDLVLLDSEKLVRLVGTTSNLSTRQFHACGAFPWMLDRPLSVQELKAERVEFLERVNRHKESVPMDEPLFTDEFAESLATEAVQIKPRCADIPVVHRLEKKL